ncbi:YeiH family protein [Niveibacterium terrae]|uniref:YeiH family protein n=1 Tax=Niveibacterium terrae TaxID=3373598 RepID=UPI003A908F50
MSSPALPSIAIIPSYLPGLALSALLAALAIFAADSRWLIEHGFSALTLAIVLGMLIGNSVYPRFATQAAPGVGFSKQRLLRLGVMLYGFRLTLQDIGQVGVTGVLIDALVVGSTFTIAYLIGTRWLGLERRTAMMIGIGSSICGAAAVMAAEPVVRARAEQVTVAVATVVVFGTLAIFVYPLLYSLNVLHPLIAGGAHGFGIYAGSTIHEVAQVVAAARSIGSSAADAAVITKMVRVMMLAPFLIGLSLWLARSEEGAQGRKITVPWFAFGFIAIVIFNSLGWLPRPVLAAIAQLDMILLAMAMAALGLTTHVKAIREAGIRPLLLASLLFVWLLVGGGAINHFVSLALL